MSEPTTLRALSDLPQSPVSLAESTLIMIDCQNTYTGGVIELDGVQSALDEAAALLDRARSAGIPIIHIQHSDGPGSLYDIEGETGAIVDRVAPRNGEPVVVTNYPNGIRADGGGRRDRDPCAAGGKRRVCACGGDAVSEPGRDGRPVRRRGTAGH